MASTSGTTLGLSNWLMDWLWCGCPRVLNLAQLSLSVANSTPRLSVASLVFASPFTRSGTWSFSVPRPWDLGLVAYLLSPREVQLPFPGQGCTRNHTKLPVLLATFVLQRTVSHPSVSYFWRSKWSAFVAQFRQGNGNPLQYSSLGNPMESRAWWTPVQELTKSWTWLCD